MNLFKRLFKGLSKELSENEIKQYPVDLSLDDSFVHHFIQNGGKFLYSTNMDEIVSNLKLILAENNWSDIICNDYDLLNLVKPLKVNIHSKLNDSYPFFTSCEHLTADNGEILFSSNQLESIKLNEFSKNFIVYGTTSQIVKNTSEGLTGIKTNYKGNIPTNISSIKYYSIEDKNDFMNYGNTNSKNLYLLLFEDL